MATATNRVNQTSTDEVAVFSDPELLNQVLDDVFAERPVREARIVSAQPAAVVIKPPPAPARRSTHVAYQPRPRTSATAPHAEEPDWFYRIAQTLCIGLIILGAAMCYRCLPSSWPAENDPSSNSQASAANATPTARSSGEKRLITKPIEAVRVGDRLVGRNPLREQAELIEPDPATWRSISLFLPKESGAGLWIELLRPLTWIEDHSAQPGSTIYLELHEMGAIGDAEVTALGPCPEIKAGQGTVVTGTFKHQADENSNVVHLQLEDQIELTGVTSNHAYWSVDRQYFVEVGQLRAGELVDTEFGLKHVVSVTPIEHNGFLYNLETTEHVYRVGSLGTLVHNTCHAHHPIPKFLGGDVNQVFSRLDPKIHTELHSLLRENLRKAGLPLNAGGRGGSASDWARYMNANPGSQRRALDAALDASRSIDVKHGTNITQDVWNNLMNGRFRMFP